MKYSTSQLTIASKKWAYETTHEQFLASDFHDNMWVWSTFQEGFDEYFI